MCTGHGEQPACLGRVRGKRQGLRFHTLCWDKFTPRPHNSLVQEREDGLRLDLIAHGGEACMEGERVGCDSIRFMALGPLITSTRPTRVNHPPLPARSPTMSLNRMVTPSWCRLRSPLRNTPTQV